MARIVIAEDLDSTFYDNQGEKHALGRSDFEGVALKCRVPVKLAWRRCLDELVHTFLIHHAETFDIIETPDGVFYRCSQPALPV